MEPSFDELPVSPYDHSLNLSSYDATALVPYDTSVPVVPLGPLRQSSFYNFSESYQVDYPSKVSSDDFSDSSMSSPIDSPFTVDDRNHPTTIHHALVVRSIDIKRMKHRNVDANRRIRESAAMDKLQSLCILEGSGTENRKKKKRCPKLDKVSILDAAATNISNLTMRVNELESLLESLCPQSLRLNKSVSKKRKINNCFSVQSFLNEQSLLSSMLRNSNIMHVVVDMETGVCLFVNKKLVEASRWEYEDIVGRQIAPSSQFMISNPHAYFDSEFQFTPTLIHPVDYVNDTFRRLYQKINFSVTHILRTSTKHGKSADVQVNASVSEDADHSRMLIHVCADPNHIVKVASDDDACLLTADCSFDFS